MLEALGLGFAAPWALAALALLPIIWWLLKLTPPAPKRVPFPAVRLLFGLDRKEETPAKAPPWLIALRIAAVTLLIVALAGPTLNAGAPLTGDGALVLVVDDGWAAARRWERRQAEMLRLIDQAERAGRPVVVATTAPPPGEAEAAAPSRLMRAADARALVQTLAPKPWTTERMRAARALSRLGLAGTVDVVWLTDGLDDGRVEDFIAALRRVGPTRVVTEPAGDAARLLRPPKNTPGGLRLAVERAAVGRSETVWLAVRDEDGKLLVRRPVAFGKNDARASADLALPVELRNRIARIEIEDERSAAAVALLDERWRRRPVGLVSGSPIEADQPLLSPLYYLERALAPFSELRKGELGALLRRPLAVLVLADVAKIGPADRGPVERWVRAGGVLVRFAGPQMAEGTDDLVPVALRSGGRALGGALSWSRPAKLAPFDPRSPFAGLKVPDDVTVRRQVLAEPSLDLAAKTWARLADGTPLVTAARHGEGWLVLVHTTANARWSNLALSGLFVEMLHRLVGLSQGVSGQAKTGMLAPIKTLDGFGRLVAPPAEARPIAAAAFDGARAGPVHPPGFYGASGERRALNLGEGLPSPRPVAHWPLALERAVYGESAAIDLGPWLLAVATLLMIVDLVAGLALRGLLRGLARRGAAAGLALGLAAGLALSLPAEAQAAEDADAFALKASLQTHLAYVKTGDVRVDEISRAGLAGLSDILRARTSIEPAEPMAIDVETDEMIFFPLIYWPVTAAQPRLSPEAVAKVNHFLKTGGIILFDTRDQNLRFLGQGPGAERLRRLLEGVNVGPLQPVPPDHVLTRAFYLLQDFPGRWAGGRVWVERHEGGVNDGVSPLVIGGNDWAAAWAMDDRRRPLFAAVPGGERQRELAFRFGINLVMYAMTGNYKADQVHLPAILERLGQ